MKKLIPLVLGCVFVLLFGVSLIVPRRILAQDHVLAPSDLRNDLNRASATRAKNQEELETFVSLPEAQNALKTAHVDAREVKNAIPQLSDDELAQLSARAEKARNDFAAGRMSDRDLLYILIAAAVIILIIVAVR